MLFQSSPASSLYTMKLFLLLSVASLASAGPAPTDEQLTQQLVKRDAEPSPDAAPDADPSADPQVLHGHQPQLYCAVLYCTVLYP